MPYAGRVSGFGVPHASMQRVSFSSVAGHRLRQSYGLHGQLGDIVPSSPCPFSMTAGARVDCELKAPGVRGITWVSRFQGFQPEMSNWRSADRTLDEPSQS